MSIETEVFSKSQNDTWRRRNSRTLTFRLDAFEDSLENILKSHTELSREIPTIYEKINTITTELDEVKKETNPEEMMKEVELRLSKRNNIIISGLPEATTGTLEERKREDMKKVGEILKELNVEGCEIENSFRIGRNLQRQRLICVKMKEFRTKSEILRKAKLLRNSRDFKHCYINPDRTFAQRRMDKELRDALKNRIKEGFDVVIKGGRVIPREDFNRMNFL